MVATNGRIEEWDRDGGIGGKAADAFGVGKGEEEIGVPVWVWLGGNPAIFALRWSSRIWNAAVLGEADTAAGDSQDIAHKAQHVPLHLPRVEFSQAELGGQRRATAPSGR